MRWSVWLYAFAISIGLRPVFTNDWEYLFWVVVLAIPMAVLHGISVHGRGQK